jgi:hypothetical protein
VAEKAEAADAAKRKASVLRRLGNEGVDNFEDVLLLAARQLGDGFKRLPDFAARRNGAARLRLA